MQQNASAQTSLRTNSLQSPDVSAGIQIAQQASRSWPNSVATSANASVPTARCRLVKEDSHLVGLQAEVLMPHQLTRTSDGDKVWGWRPLTLLAREDLRS